MIVLGVFFLFGSLLGLFVTVPGLVVASVAALGLYVGGMAWFAVPQADMFVPVIGAAVATQFGYFAIVLFRVVSGRRIGSKKPVREPAARDKHPELHAAVPKLQNKNPS